MLSSHNRRFLSSSHIVYNYKKKFNSRRLPSTASSVQATQAQSQAQATQGGSLMSSGLVMLGVGYLAIINAAAVALFAYDKYQAQQRGWRVPEKTLQLSALLGGWLGGMWAMNQFRHKTQKQEFRVPYFACVGLNVAVGSALCLRPAMIPQSLKTLARSYLNRYGIKI